MNWTEELARSLERSGKRIHVETLEVLVSEGAINEKTAKVAVVRLEFFRQYTKTDRTAADIEADIAAQYDLKERTVRKYRTLK